MIDIKNDWMLDSDLLEIYLKKYSLDKELDLEVYQLEEKLFKKISFLATITVD